MRIHSEISTLKHGKKIENKTENKRKVTKPTRRSLKSKGRLRLYFMYILFYILYFSFGRISHVLSRGMSSFVPEWKACQSSLAFATRRARVSTCHTSPSPPPPPPVTCTPDGELRITRLILSFLKCELPRVPPYIHFIQTHTRVSVESINMPTRLYVPSSLS